MHEQEKIAEAKYFLDRIAKTEHNPDGPNAFAHNLSAFLSAARSPLQYACKDIGDAQPGRRWYDGQVSQSAVVKFFRDQRNFSIHAKPVNLSATVSVQTFDVVAAISDGLRVVVKDQEGNAVQESEMAPSPPPAARQADSTASVSSKHYFSDWTGPEDAIDLCSQYLAEVKRIIADGVANGFLTAS